MFLIQGISADTNQTQTLLLQDGSPVQLTISYIPQQLGWFITSLIYQSFTLQGFRIFTSPNMLQQYKSKIPFGLACFTTDLYEPTQQQDFSSKYANLFILSAAEVQQWTEILNGQIQP